MCIFICTKQKTTSLFLFVNKQLCHSRQNKNFSIKLNLCRFAVRRVYQRYQQAGGYTKRQDSGRKRATTQRDDSFVVSTSLRNRCLNAVRQQLQNVREVEVSRWIVRRRLAEAGLTVHRPAIGPKLTPAHRQARPQYPRNHVNWTMDQTMEKSTVL